MSEAQKADRSSIKNRLEKEFTLVFNKEESLFVEEEQLDAISGATDSLKILLLEKIIKT